MSNQELFERLRQDAMCQVKYAEQCGDINWEKKYQDLQTKFEKEHEENKSLRLTLALRTDCEQELERVRYEHNPEVEVLSKKLASAEKEILVMESTNKELMVALDNLRTQLGKMLRERNQKAREVENLEEEIDSLQKSYQTERHETVSDKYSSNLVLLLDEINDQAAKWKAEKTEMTARFEEAIGTLKSENESLKAQKEDIVNHSKNSDKMWHSRLDVLTADFQRVHFEMQANQFANDEKTSGELNGKIRELTRKLNDALEAIEEVESDNYDLRERLEDSAHKNFQLENDVDFQKKLLKEGQTSYFDNCEKYETQLQNLNEEMAKLEELRDSNQQEINSLLDKMAQQTITFSNEKAKFCHDMERTEEKWNNEVMKLREKSEAMEKMLFNATKDSMNKKEAFDEENQHRLERIGELESLLKLRQMTTEREVQQLHEEIKSLKEQLKESKEAEKTALHEWDGECSDLEGELNTLIEKRRTESKKLKSMSRKNLWLAGSIKKLAEQRRRELESKNIEIQKLNSLCELQRKEKVEWLSDLKKEVNEWKDETHIRIEMKNKIEELEKLNNELSALNEDLEEKVENVTATWRAECEAYENNLATICYKQSQERESYEMRLKASKKMEDDWIEKFEQMCKSNEVLEKMLMTQKTEANDLQRATVELSKLELDNMRTVMEMEMKEILKERGVVIKDLEQKLFSLAKEYTNDKKKLSEANNSISRWKNEVKYQAEARELERDLYNGEIDNLKETNEKLKNNMGVEELEDDTLSTSSDESSDSEDDSSSCEELNHPDTDEGDNLYHDMPKLRDERIELKKENSGEWELVNEDA